MKINIIDPSSTEFNRGSFCYTPYLCYIGLSELGHEVTLMESFIPENINNAPDADIQLICLWSYPQIECCILLQQLLPFEKGKDNVYFVGYTSLIEAYGFRHIGLSEKSCCGDLMRNKSFLTLALQNYPEYYGRFNRLLLSDCDMHLQTLEKGEKVYPLFTSYGCPNGCVFCPSTINCNKERIVLDLMDVENLTDNCIHDGIHYIHFTDEDFFFDIERAEMILQSLEDRDMHLIALGSAKNVKDYIDKYGTETIQKSGLEVIEIGFESASPELSVRMGAGKSLSDCEALAEIQDRLPCKIFWLVQTFFIGETISTLNETGRFMCKYGFEMNEVVGRLRTNGTKGGLGQFFQVYDGTPIYNKALQNGVKLTERPIRLIPSYIPNSFLDSIINSVQPENMADALPWLKLYNLSFNIKSLVEGRTIRNHFVNTKNPINTILTFAILARLEVIR